jgi:type I restriction enzyme M protein
LHTILRLPPGLFYAAGVKSNVIFFDKPVSSSSAPAECVWVYDLRSDKRFSLRTKPLQAEDLQEFVTLFKADRRDGGERHRSFATSEVISHPDCRLDLTWSDASAARAPGLARLDELSSLVADDLLRALELITRPINRTETKCRSPDAQTSEPVKTSRQHKPFS